MNQERKQYRDLSMLIRGASLGLQAVNPEFAAILDDAANKLKIASENICAQGYFGCLGGELCTADHK
jgi:hypothetical protein